VILRLNGTELSLLLGSAMCEGVSFNSEKGDCRWTIVLRRRTAGQNPRKQPFNKVGIDGRFATPAAPFACRNNNAGKEFC
jgi:hypothetical protein